ncbi:MAG TPA: amidohydrolase [Ktedonobacterales bacterium]|nr:amidohydrolase [Ktedonobacterales bacterium]
MVLSRRPVLLLLNGDIHTMDAANPHATALAIDRSSGRILAVGDDTEIRSLVGPLTDTIDLGGRTALPGFIDAHTHLAGYAETRLNVDLRHIPSEDAAVAKVRERAATLPPGTWIYGQSWDVNEWPSQRFPTKASLDATVPEHPVMLSSHDFHSIWVNSAALRLANITAQTPDPAGGRIERDGDGEPTGMLFEGPAEALVESVAAPVDDDILLGELRRVLAELRARGITGVHNIEDARSLRLMQRLHAEGALQPRILLYIRHDALEEALTLGVEAGFGDDYLRLAGIKMFMDGALGSHTAAMLDPYEGDGGNRGLLVTSEPEVIEEVRNAAGGNLGVAIHAIGDRAVRAALNGIEATLREGAQTGLADGSPVRRFRLEHVQLAAPEDLQRMARLGVVGSVQPFHAVVDRFSAERFWGARHKRAYAYQTMRQLGIPLALGSDVPVDTADPLRILHAAIVRRDDRHPEQAPWLPDQALTLREALYAYTLGAAYAGGQEGRQGSLAPGKLADLVVLTENPFTLPAERLAGAEVAATLVGGEMVHGALE